MSTDQTSPKRQVRVHRTPEFKSQLVKLALEPGASISDVAMAHGVNASLLARWVKESKAFSKTPAFVPVQIKSSLNPAPYRPENNSQPINVKLTRRDLHIQFNVDSSQMPELGQVLREVLR